MTTATERTPDSSVPCSDSPTLSPTLFSIPTNTTATLSAAQVSWKSASSKDFKFTSNNSVDYNETRYSSITNPYYGGYASSNGIVTKTSTHRLSTTFQQLLNWNHMFNGVHEVTALVGHEFYQDKYNNLSANRSNMFDPSNDELDGAILSGESGSYRTYYNNEGWLFRGQYNYAQKYFGSVSFRRDASSRFHPDNRWGNFWSA